MVQDFALDIVLMGERQSKAEDFLERFKLALMGSDPLLWANKVFPEFVGADQVEPVVERFDPEDEKLIGVTLKFPELTEEEREALLQEMMTDQQITLGADDFDDEGWL